MKNVTQTAFAVFLGLGVLAQPLAAQDTLRIATEGYYAPFNYYDQDGKLAGFDVDVSLALCGKLAVECEIVQQDWDDLIPGLVAGNYDAIIASMSITPVREEQVAFTLPYYSNMLSFIGKSDVSIDISADGLKGKSVGTLKSTVSSEYLQTTYDGVVDINLYETQDQALEDLVRGNLDLVLGDNLPSYAWLQTDAGKDHQFIGEFIDINDRIAIAVSRNDEDLLARFNAALIEILEDGTYQTINAKYFPFSIYF